MNSPDIVVPTQESNVPAAREVKPIDNVRGLLEKMKPQFQAVLPTKMNIDQFMRIALTSVQQTPKLLNCDTKSLIGAIMRSAQLGLEPSGLLGQAYLIPYGNQVQFIVGYKGLLDLARRSGEVISITVQEVRERDEFSVDWSQEMPFTHKPLLKGERGEITYVWALARFKDGGHHWDYMPLADVIKIRDESSGYQSAKKYGKLTENPWTKHFGEMAKKTMIRRIAKYLPMDVQRATKTEDLADAGKAYTFDKNGEIFVMDDERPIIDGTATDTTDQAAIPNQVTPEVTQPAPAKKPTITRAKKETAPAAPVEAQAQQPQAAATVQVVPQVTPLAEAPRPFVSPLAPKPAAPAPAAAPAGNFDEFGE